MEGKLNEGWKIFILYIGALIIGLIGTAIYLVSYHAYLDHRFVDFLREQIQQQQQQQKK